MAALTDGDRVLIISLTTAIWSAAVALCATIGSFSQLLLVRIGVAVGEAGCIPPAHSLIADYFTRATSFVEKVLHEAFAAPGPDQDRSG